MNPIALRESIERLQAACDSSTLDAQWDCCVARLEVGGFPTDFRRLSANAYATFCRTMRGLRAAFSPSDVTRLRERSDISMRAQIERLVGAPPRDQRAFDAWHAETCASLQAVWAPAFPLTAGQSQKWLNILLKTIVALGPKGPFPSIRPIVRPVGHAPIDSIVYRALAGAHDVPLSGSSVRAWFTRERLVPWSKIDDRRKYDALQDTLRQIAGARGASAADLELFIW